VILNTEKVERAIEGSIHAQRRLSAQVSCPVNIEQKQGKTFTCYATVRARRYPVLVNQIDSKGHVRYLVR
jgi:hypothetical protein